MYNVATMKPKPLALILLIFILGSAITYAQVPAPPIPVEEIIKKFSEKEKEFKLARANYTYREVVSVEELTPDDRVRGKFEQTSEIGFDSKGKRTAKVI